MKGDPVESLLRLESELRLASAGYYRCRDYGGVCMYYYIILYLYSSNTKSSVIHTRSTDKH